MLCESLAVCLALWATSATAVIMEPAVPVEAREDEQSDSFGENLGSCMAKKSHGVFECANRGALSVLQSWNEQDDLDFGEFHFQRAEGQSRDLLDLDYDPKDFGNVVKAVTRLIERRNFKWDMGYLYPGLLMRVGPTLTGDGLLEFVMDERLHHYNSRNVGAGRSLLRQLLLPFLLGFKFNLASMIPLLFGILLLVTKKALLLTKIAIVISGLLGWNSMFSGWSAGHSYPSTLGGGGGGGGFHGYGQDHLGGGIGGGPLQHQDPTYYPRPYRAHEDFPYTSQQHVIREVVNVYDNDESKISRNGKNFVWNRDE